MSANHTPEPWKADSNPRDIFGPTRDIARVLGTFEDDEADANARRILAAVNVCAGIPTTVLEDLAREPNDDEGHGPPTTIREVCQRAVAMLTGAGVGIFRALDALAGDDEDD